MKSKSSYLYRFTLSLILFLITGGAMSHAEATQSKVVRVGWYESPFCHIDSLGRRSGYAYDYQRRIAANTGWTYEYVEGKWGDLLDSLVAGNIDLMSGVSKMPDRMDKMFFSNYTMGYEDFSIITLIDQSGINAEDIHSLEGKRLGVPSSTYQVQLVKDWLKQNNLNVELVELRISTTEYVPYLKSGKIDALAVSSSLSSGIGPEIMPIVHLGNAPYFFAVNKNRPDLNDELNYALEHIRTHNSFYNSKLREKYLSDQGLSSFLPSREKQWLKNHGKIRIAYRDNFMPFCSYDAEQGHCTGLLHDFIEQTQGAFYNTDIEFETIAYPNINEAMEAVQKGEADLAFPTFLNEYDAETSHLLITDPLVTTAEMAVMRTESNYDPSAKNRAAINHHNPNYISLIKSNYPQWKLVDFNSPEDCLVGVASGKADLILFCNFRIAIMHDIIEDLGLKAVATGLESNLAFTTKEGNNELYFIMNRLAQMPTEANKLASLVKYYKVPRNTSIRHFIKHNTFPVFIFLLLLGFVILYLLRNSIKANRKAHTRLKEIFGLNQELLTAKKVAEEANAAKTSFLFNMSHDIRTPMNAIMGFRDLLEKYQDDPVKRQDYLKKIETSSDVLLSIINNVLEMARIEKGTIVIDETAWSTQQFADMIFGMFQEMMEKKKLKFTYKTDVEHQYVYCDSIKLREVLMNLLSNAYKYTPSGSVDVCVKEIPCNREGYATYQTTITDTGIGMSEEFLPHVFEEFSRENNTTDNKIEGTGLGMPIVKRLVELMGGTIEVKSKKGEGTTFILTIHHRIAERSCLVDHSGVVFDPKIFEGKRILLAEDNELNAEIAMEILKEKGFVIELAADGQICCDMLANAPEHYYDVILMDIQMPNMNGYEATRFIRKMDNSIKANIPILAMTANAFEEDKQEALRSGMNGHLAKPVDVPEMMKALARVLC